MTGKELVPFDPVQFAREETEVERGFWDKVRCTLGAVPFVEEAVAAYFCAIDRDTPLRVKAILIGALAYFVAPADLVPDVVTFLGFTDDAAVLATAVRAVASHIGPGHRARARRVLGSVEHEAPAA